MFSSLEISEPGLILNKSHAITLLLKQNDMINIKRIFSKFFIILSIKTFYFY